MSNATAPDRTEASEDYFEYIGLVGPGDIGDLLEAWSRRGIARDNPFTVRALAYITVGPVAYHVKIVRERYLQLS